MEIVTRHSIFYLLVRLDRKIRLTINKILYRTMCMTKTYKKIGFTSKRNSFFIGLLLFTIPSLGLAKKTVAVENIPNRQIETLIKQKLADYQRLLQAIAPGALFNQAAVTFYEQYVNANGFLQGKFEQDILAIIKKENPRIRLPQNSSEFWSSFTNDENAIAKLAFQLDFVNISASQTSGYYVFKSNSSSMLIEAKKLTDYIVFTLKWGGSAALLVWLRSRIWNATHYALHMATRTIPRQAFAAARANPRLAALVTGALLLSGYSYEEDCGLGISPPCRMPQSARPSVVNTGLAQQWMNSPQSTTLASLVAGELLTNPCALVKNPNGRWQLVAPKEKLPDSLFHLDIDRANNLPQQVFKIWLNFYNSQNTLNDSDIASMMKNPIFEFAVSQAQVNCPNPITTQALQTEYQRFLTDGHRVNLQDMPGEFIDELITKLNDLSSSPLALNNGAICDGIKHWCWPLSLRSTFSLIQINSQLHSAAIGYCSNGKDEGLKNFLCSTVLKY